MKEKKKRDFEFPQNYHTIQELNSALETLCTQYSDLMARYSLGASTGKNEIWSYIISSDQTKLKSKPAALILSCHHGREAITSEAAYYSMKYLLTGYSTNSQIQQWLDHGAIIYIPMVNPDAHDVVERKNKNWVDLNRNYTFNWGLAPGSSHEKISEIYCGPAALSEVESQLINKMKIVDDLFVKYKNIKTAVDLHSGAEVLLYPWGYIRKPSPDDALFKDLCKQMEQKAKEMQVQFYEYQPAIELYPTSGTFLDHVYQFYHCISFVAEIYKGTWAGDIWEFFNPPSEQVETLCHRVLPILLTLINHATKV